MADYDIIVIGSSTGGVMALKQLVAALPADFKIPIFIVQHVAPGSDNFLAQTLDQAGPLPAVYPRDGAEIVGGTILRGTTRLPPSGGRRPHSCEKRSKRK